MSFEGLILCHLRSYSDSFCHFHNDSPFLPKVFLNLFILYLLKNPCQCVQNAYMVRIYMKGCLWAAFLYMYFLQASIICCAYPYISSRFSISYLTPFLFSSDTTICFLLPSRQTLQIHFLLLSSSKIPK